MNGGNSNTSGLDVASTIDFSPKGVSDQISNERMEEICRRLVITMEQQSNGTIVFSAQAPDDKSRVWWQIDGTTGLPIGQPKTWDANAHAWLPVTLAGSGYVPAQRRYLTQFAAAGNSNVNINFDDIGTTNYTVIVTPTTYIGSVWAPAPVSFGTHFGYTVVNKSTNQIGLSFYGTPTGGIQFEIDLIERTGV